MKTVFRIILLVLLACSTTSCLTMMALAAASDKAIERGDEFGRDNADMVLKTFQRVAGYAALATTGSGDIACVIADFGQYYDGLVLDGRFIRKGTYSYVTTGGAKRTVLVYLYKPHKKDLESYANDFVRNQKPVVAENPSVITI